MTESSDSAWCLCCVSGLCLLVVGRPVALLIVVVVAGRLPVVPEGRVDPTLPGLVCEWGFNLMVCSVARHTRRMNVLKILC